MSDTFPGTVAMRRVRTPARHVAAAFVMFFSLAFAGMQPAGAADREVYLATLPGYPPFTFYHPDRRRAIEQVLEPGQRGAALTGYSWDIARAAFAAAGYTVRLRVTPWARAMYELRRGKTEVLFPTGRNPERLEYLHYSRNSVVDVDFRVYVRDDSALEYESLDSLRGRTIAVMRGFNYGETFNAAAHFERIVVDSLRQGFELLEGGRVDGFAGYDVVWDYRLREWGWEDRFRKLAPFDGTREYLVALRDNPDGIAAVEAFDRGYGRIRDTGELARIRARWEGD